MVEHPWIRTPALANMIGLMLVSIGVIIGGLEIGSNYFVRIEVGTLK